MIPLPDWTRLRRYPAPKSALPDRGGCSDFSGCILGCGGLLVATVLILETARHAGVWAGLGALIVICLVTVLLGKVSRVITGLLLGGLSAVGVWFFMQRDYANERGWSLFNAALAFCLFALAGRWEQQHRVKNL